MPSFIRSFLLAGAAGLAFANSAQAGLSFVNTQRTVIAAAGHVVEPLSLAEDVEQHQLPGFATETTQSADASFLQPQDNDFQYAIVSQRTLTRNDDFANELSVNAGGRLITFSADEQALARSLFDTTFDLSESTEFTLSGGLTLRTDNSFGRNARGGVTLTRVGGGDETVFEHEFDATETDGLKFDESGTLPAGRYSLAFDATLFGSSSSGQQEVDYGFNLLLGTTLDGNGPGGGEPNPIPLPPAVWSGLALLAAGALNRARKSRFAR